MDWVGLAPGSEVGGYRIVAPLGSGGMGTVYRAEDGGGTPVALKLLHPHVGADPASRERLRREVAALQRLRHRGVAAVLDAEADSTDAFLVTELVEGTTLDGHVREHGPLGAAELADLARGLREALAAVHAAGVVHRDLKPSNVMLTDDGPVLIDFGIAQAADEVRVTSTGFVVGTPGYLAPELLADGAPSAHTDWWGWAAVLAFAATGRPPFGTRPMDAVIARTRAGDVDLIGLGRITAAALEGALHPQPSSRSAPGDVVGELQRAAEVGDGPAPTEVLTVALAPRRGTRPGPAGSAVHGDDGTGDDGTGAPWGEPGVAGPPEGDPATRVLALDTGTRAMPVVPSGDPDPARWGGDAGHPPGDPGEGMPGAPYVPQRARRRTGTLLALGLLATAAATLYPGITVVVVATAVLLVRAVGTAVEAVQRRRLRRGSAARGDVARAVVSGPWHVLRALVGLLPSLVVAASVVVVVGGLLWWALATGRLAVLGGDGQPGPGTAGPAATWTASAVLGAAVLAGLVAVWWGPLARGTRAGARWTLHALAPGWSGAAVLSTLALAAAAVLAVLAATGQPIVWWPLPGPPVVR